MKTTKAPEMREAEFQEQVLQLAHLLGWRTAHFRAARTAHGWRTPLSGDGKGFADTVLCRDRVIFAELKRESGKQSVDQQEWAAALKAAGAEVYCWRPSQFDEIVEILKGDRK